MRCLHFQLLFFFYLFLMFYTRAYFSFLPPPQHSVHNTLFPPSSEPPVGLHLRDIEVFAPATSRFIYYLQSLLCTQKPYLQKTNFSSCLSTVGHHLTDPFLYCCFLSLSVFFFFVLFVLSRSRWNSSTYDKRIFWVQRWCAFYGCWYFFSVIS